MSATCGTCRWWDDLRPDAEMDGLCRRHAPRASPDRWNRSYWPETDATDWCGEHQPKETRDEA